MERGGGRCGWQNFSTFHVTERALAYTTSLSGFKPKQNRHSTLTPPLFLPPPLLPSETAAPLDNFGVPQCVCAGPPHQARQGKATTATATAKEWAPRPRRPNEIEIEIEEVPSKVTLIFICGMEGP
jgi:hypothetical protein